MQHCKVITQEAQTIICKKLRHLTLTDDKLFIEFLNIFLNFSTFSTFYLFIKFFLHRIFTCMMLSISSSALVHVYVGYLRIYLRLQL